MKKISMDKKEQKDLKTKSGNYGITQTVYKRNPKGKSKFRINPPVQIDSGDNNDSSKH